MLKANLNIIITLIPISSAVLVRAYLMLLAKSSILPVLCKTKHKANNETKQNFIIDITKSNLLNIDM